MLYVCLTFDWEGEHFNNIRDFKRVMDTIGADIPVTHFICPAYFSGKVSHAEDIISNTVKNNDEVGLHVHCYKSLIRAAGIEFRTSPDYYNNTVFFSRSKKLLKKLVSEELVNKWKQLFISGRGVPLSAYDTSEIEKILRFSINILSNNLKRNILSFRAGGWLANDAVYEALMKTGIQIDSSAVPPQVVGKANIHFPDEELRDDYGETYPVFSDFVRLLWGTSIQSSGFLSNRLRLKSYGDSITHNTFSFDIHSLKVLVNNFGMSDFATFNLTIKPWLEKINNWEEHDYVINYGCHQEGDLFYKKPVVDLVKYLKNDFQNEVKFVTVSDLNQIVNSNQLKFQ